MATREELIGNIRQKYPEYGDLSDDQLAAGVARKYPEYALELGAPAEPQFAEDRFTPSQQAALSAFGGPLGALIGQIATGSPVTQTEAAAEGALETIGRLPGQLGGMALRAFTPAPLRLIAPSALETAIQDIERPFIQAPETIEAALGLPPTSERAFFREPEFGAIGEIGGQLFPPTAAAPREAAQAGATVARAVSEGLGAVGTIPAVEATGRLASAITGSIKGGARMALEKATPKPLIENIVNTLDPRANAINPAKQVQAMKTATASVRRIVNDLTPEDLAHPQTLADNATAKLQAIHAERDALSGVSSTISLDPLADAYIKIANDPVIKTKFPRIVPQLEETAAQYRGKTLSGSDGERFNQVLNAENHTLYEKVPGARAAAEKANPELAAGLEASKALRTQLDNAFGNEFGELGKDYGAWKEVADLAQRQAVKQAKIENRLSLYEGLSGLQAIATSGSPFKTIATLAGGQILKFAGSPLARFEGAARRLSEAIDKGQVPQRPPTLPQRPPPLPTVPTIVTPTLEQQLQDIVQFLPREMRGRNERAIAEAILRANPPPP